MDIGIFGDTGLMRTSEVCDMIVLNEAFFLMVKAIGTSKKKTKFESCCFILILDIH